jgi:glutathione S-transferase
LKPLKLLEFAISRSIRVRWTLQELGVAFEAVTIDLFAGEHRRREFLKISPAGRLPVLIDGDAVLTESVAIVLFLAEKYPEKKLIPTDIWHRAQLNRWFLLTTTELEQPLWRMRRHTAVYPQDKRLPGEVALAGEEFAAMAKVLEDHMCGRKFVVGDTVTVGDFVLAHTLDWAKTARMLNGLPQLEAYTEQMYARPNAPMRIAEALALSNSSRVTRNDLEKA